jgi:hypothetical protein
LEVKWSTKKSKKSQKLVPKNQAVSKVLNRDGRWLWLVAAGAVGVFFDRRHENDKLGQNPMEFRGRWQNKNLPVRGG